MPAGNNSAATLASRLRELGLVLPKAPTPLGAYVAASQAGSLLFLSGMLPLVNGNTLHHRTPRRKPLCRARPRGGAACGDERPRGRAAASGRPGPDKQTGETKRCSGDDRAVCRACRRRGRCLRSLRSALWRRKRSCANCVRCPKPANRHACRRRGHLRDKMTSVGSDARIQRI